MANPVDFANDYFAQVASLIQTMENLRTLNDRMVQDTGLVTAYFANPVHRTDIVAADFTAATTAVTGMLFAFDSGTPVNKQSLFKML